MFRTTARSMRRLAQCHVGQPWPNIRRAAGTLICVSTLVSTTHADWSNSGGNAGRNGMTSAVGPDTPDIQWSGSRPAIIAYQPVIEGNRVFMVRQSGFVGSEPNASPIVAQDLITGGELWAEDVPFNSGDWTTWVAGVRNGRVFASRSGNGATVSARLHCLDAVTGDQCWMSQDLITAGAYDGVVFAANGDPVIASFTTIKRIRAIDGSTAWTAMRIASVSGNCGAAVHGSAVYVADAAVGGHVIKRYNIDTGAFQYQSPLMTGFTIQNTPMVGPDGTVYLSRTQNNPNTDYFYAFIDTGTSLIFKWVRPVPANWSTSSEFAVGPDGSIYMMGPGYRIHRLNPVNGATINMSDPITIDNPNGNITPRMAADAQGRIFFSNGQFSTGRFYSFNADLTPRWSVAVPNINIGAPAIGSNGTLVVAGVGANVVAYRTAPPCPADIAPQPTPNGVVNIDDLLLVINSWGALGGPADVNNSGMVNIDDLLAVINAWGACP